MSIKKVGLSILRGVLNEIEIQKWLNKNISLKKDTLFIENKKISLPKNGKAILICTGKSASSLAYAFQKKLNKKIKHTYIFSPKKYYKKYPLKKTTTYLGTHPKINKKTLKNTESFLNKIENHKKTDFYIFLISGGTSSSIEKLKKHISLKKYNQLINEMIFSGQSINKINRIRTSLSEVKGGKILKFFKKNIIFGLYISDVPTNDFYTIGSGLTAVQNKAKKTFENVKNIMIADYKTALVILKRQIKNYRFNLHEISKPIDEDAMLLSKKIANLVHRQGSKPFAISWCGESRIAVKTHLRGGRNLHLTLLMANALKNFKRPFFFVSYATDNKDGTSPVGGAFLTHNVLKQLSQNEVQKALKKFNSYDYLNQKS